MKTLLLAISFLLTGLVSFAQHSCGFDHFNKVHSFGEMDQRLMHRKLSASGGDRDIVTIPVVFHVIHNNGPENMPDQTILDGLEQLNQRLANEGSYFNETGHNVPIRFCLASVNPEGQPETGIQRIQSPLTIFDGTTVSDLEFKNLSRWEPMLYLNVWLLKDMINTPYAGYSNFPQYAGTGVDGIVMEYLQLNTSTFVHEVGHYLGLYHTFEGGCENDNSLLQGDRVSDTPPDVSQNGECMLNSCDTDMNDQSGFNPFTSDVNELPNYMDYTSCPFSFSLGQSERMYNSLLEFRSSLLQSNGCGANPGGAAPSNVAIQSSWQCYGTSLTATGDNIVGLAWDYDGDGLVDDTGLNVQPMPDNNGIQTVTVWAYGYNGVISTSQEVSIFHAPYQNYPLVNGFSGIGYSEIYDGWAFCEGDQIQLFGEPGMVSYQWSTGATAQNLSIIGGSEPLYISLSATDEYGNVWTSCQTFDAVNAPATITPVLSLEEDFNNCIGSTTVLHIESSPIAQFLILTNAFGQVTYLNSDEFYFTIGYSNAFNVVQIDSNGCTAQSEYLNFIGLDPVQQGDIIQNGNQLTYNFGMHYRWYLDGVAIPNSDFATITAVDYGCYTVESWWISEECTSFSANQICIEAPAGIEKNEPTEYSLFPNPANEEAYITGPNVHSITLFDAVGKKIETEVLNANQQKSISTIQLPDGIYTVLINGKIPKTLVISH